MAHVTSARVRAAFAIPVAALLLVGGPAHAQTTSGSIGGTVVDDSGLVLPGATITLIGEETGSLRVVPTNGVGAFTFASVVPGIYTVRIELQGFATYEQTNNNLATNQQMSIGVVELGLAGLTEVVQVTATEQRVVETITSDRSALITEEQIETITVRGRDVTSMLRVLPGVSYEKDAEATGEIVIGSWLPEVTGARAGWSTVTIDGIPSNDIGLPSVSTHSMSADAVGEINVQLNNFTADSGRNGGANINIVTKSGSNDFAGGAYAYGRRERFRGQNYFDELNGIDKPLYRYSTLGGNLGGRIVQDKAFFFYNFEKWSVETPVSASQATVPTAFERMGDFSQSFDSGGNLIVVTDPLTGMPFPGNRIPADRINPNGQALLNTFPAANATDLGLTGGNFNYQFKGAQTAPRRNNVVRVDLRLNDNDAFYTRYSHWHQPSTTTRGGLAIDHTFTYDDYASVTNYTRVIGTNAVNEVSVGYRHSREWNPPSDDFDLDRITRPVAGYTLGQFSPDINPFNLIPEMSFGGFVPNAAGLGYDSRFVNFGNDDIIAINDALSWTTGRHNFKFGGYYEHLVNIEGRGASAFAGNFDFSRDTFNPFETGHPYANAMLGSFRSYTENTARLGQRASHWIFNAFAQDKWQPTNKLTFDIGLRVGSYSHYRQEAGILGDGSMSSGRSASFVTERFDAGAAPVLYRPVTSNGARMALNPVTGEIGPELLIGALVPGTGDPLNGMVLDTDSSYPDNFQDPVGLLMEPRLGVAYDLRGDGRTALRTNFGVFHNSTQAGALSWRQALNPPLVYTPQIFYGTMDTLLQTEGVTFPTNPVYSGRRDNGPPTMYNFQVGIQHEIGLQTVLDVAYVRTQGQNLPQIRNINTVPFGARFLPENQDPTRPGQALPDNFFRPYPGYGDILEVLNVGPSEYNALQVQANRRYTGGLEFTIAYTLSKAEDYTSADILYGNRSRIPYYQDPDVYSYGLADFDRTHNLVISYNWDIPDIPSGAPAFVRGLLSGWRLSGVSTFTNGTPAGIGFTTVDNADLLGGGDQYRRMLRVDGIGSVALGDRPNVNGAANLPGGERTIDRWFDTSVFSRPAEGEVGNGRKDDVRLPGVTDTGIRISKAFRFGAREQQFEVSTEIYNLFNEVSYLEVDTTAQFDAEGNQIDERFGAVIASRTPFTMLFSARYRF
jgi:hypothetical protein